MSASALQVFILRGGTLMATEVFLEGVYTVGSDPGCDVVLDDPAVALQHAQLQFGGGQVVITDDAGAGLRINGELVQEAEIKSGDDVQVGPFLLKVRPIAKRRPAAVPQRPASPPARPSARPAQAATRLASVPAAPAMARLTPVPAPAPTRALAPAPDADVDALLDSAFTNPHAPEPPPVAEPLPLEAILSPLEPPLPPLAAPPVMAPIATSATSVPLPAPAPPMAAAPPPDTSLPLPAPAPSRPAVVRTPTRPSTPMAALRTIGSAPVLHARVLWQEALMAARTFEAGQAVTTGPEEGAPLPAYGFPALQLAVPEGGGWRVTPPRGVNVLERIAHGPWTEVALDASGSAHLGAGRMLRLSSAKVHVELLVQAPPPQAIGKLWRVVDLKMALLITLCGAAVVAFIATLPPYVERPPEPPPVRRLVRAQVPPPKPKKPKREKVVAGDPQAPAAAKPSAAARATTFKGAAAPLRQLEKITRATREVSKLLAALSTVNKGGSKYALPLMPTPNRAPMAMPGIGESLGGMGGPVTRGRDLLRGSGGGGGPGALGDGTAGRGAVRGVPVSIPSRPAKVQGQIDREQVARVLNEHIGEIRGCYERALLGNPNLGAGKVALEWTIGGDGTVVEAGAKHSTIRGPEVVSCLLDLLKRLQFPKPHGGLVIVSYPILFNAVGY